MQKRLQLFEAAVEDPDKWDVVYNHNGVVAIDVDTGNTAVKVIDMYSFSVAFATCRRIRKIVSLFTNFVIAVRNVRWGSIELKGDESKSFYVMLEMESGAPVPPTTSYKSIATFFAEVVKMLTQFEDKRKWVHYADLKIENVVVVNGVWKLIDIEEEFGEYGQFEVCTTYWHALVWFFFKMKLTKDEAPNQYLYQLRTSAVTQSLCFLDMLRQLPKKIDDCVECKDDLESVEELCERISKVSGRDDKKIVEEAIRISEEYVSLYEQRALLLE